ncbi:MAG: hypothetical protein WC043_04645 [Pseudobdellovibrionaceae bacterium]
MMIPLIQHGSFHILRGDLISGGAKTPALLQTLARNPRSHIGYVGTVYGSGAWAVAQACARLNKECTLFITKGRHPAPPWIENVESLGTRINWCPPLPVATLHAEVTRNYPDIHNLPLGFDTPDFIADLAAIMTKTLPEPPPEIWLPALSGVLARAACLAFPKTPVHAVSAARHPGNLGRAILHLAPEKFHHKAKNPPPYPACPFSDAKIWQFAEKMALSGAVIWNVSS